MLPQVSVGDRVTLRKPHPCGSFDWVVTRIGTDIGLKCLACGRRVMLPRGEFNRRVKRIVPAADTESG
ncbi:MAG: DUF951 domain-containing protein [Chloroflexi bacterium]|nr:DUF951 domain-containing protein [Chloroflexota bacterium]